MKTSKIATYLILFSTSIAVFAASPAHSPQAVQPGATGPRHPVLLELFTSEGCSSCSPADRLLEILDHSQPVAGADVIVLSEHVDYWNRLGWADPFSSALFSQRQKDYVSQLHLESAYTPQLIVDGQRDVLGSDEAAARAAIAKAATNAKAVIDLNAQRFGASVKVELGVKGGNRQTDVYVALADDSAQSQVTRGENSGHTLHHVAVVRTLLLAGKTDAQGTLNRDLTVPLKDGDSGALRVVVFLQDSGSRRVLGVAQTRL